MRVPFPFVAVAGAERAKQALQLLAVDPGLKGVLVAGGPGIAKGLLSRAFSALLPAPFVEAPPALTEEELLGGLDLERTLASGRPRIAEGLLQRARGGFLYLDDAGHLDRAPAACLAAALRSGKVRVERDGISESFRGDFALIGTYNPAECDVSGVLADSAGLHVVEAGELAGDERVEWLGRMSDFDRNPNAFGARFEEETAGLRAQIERARSSLAAIELRTKDRFRLTRAAAALGVEGHRADVFAARAARASAALRGAPVVEEEDLSAAVRFVLMPRATRLPERDEQREESGPGAGGAEAEDQVFEALDTELPAEALQMSRSGSSRGRRDGNLHTRGRGRTVRVTARKREGSRVALAATLRAAAPHQQTRAASPSMAIRVTASDLRFKECIVNAGALILFAVDASGSMAVNRIQQAKGAVIRLLREAYLNRDEIALITFRGSRAEVALPPGRSVELARRALDALAVGGGTPLAAGLLAALQVARRRKLVEKRESLLVLLTDGSPNVAAGEGGRAGIWRELETACAALRDAKVGALVLDTQQHSASRGGAQRIAGMLGGRYIHLPRPNTGAVYEAVTAAVGMLRT